MSQHGDPRHHDLARSAVIVEVHPAHQVLDAGRVAADDVVWHRLGQVAEQGVGVVDHPRLADPLQPVIGEHAHVGQVPPRRADDVGLDIDDFHSFSLL